MYALPLPTGIDILNISSISLGEVKRKSSIIGEVLYMYLSQNEVTQVFYLKGWNRSHTIYSKYLISRFMQLVDTEEVITNRSPVTNGLILLEQINEVAKSTLKRPKNSNRLSKIFKEANDKSIKNSLVNDVIFEKYFSLTKQWIQHWNRDIPLDSIKEIQQQVEMFLQTIKESYVALIKKELLDLDILSTEMKGFDKKIDVIDRLLSILVAQLVFDGHSLSFLQIAPKKLYVKNPNNLIENLYRYFHYNKEEERGTYLCFMSGTINGDLKSILDIQDAVVPKESFYKQDSSVDLSGYSFAATGADPYSAFRNEVVMAFRKISLVNPKFNQDMYDHVWEGSFYSNSGTNKYVKYDFRRNNDPAIVKYRNNTLITTLQNSGRELSAFSDLLTKIEEPLHFYHLATTATSIENSYILLWTALESLMGLRTNNSDISDVTENVKRAITLGAVGRRVSSFALRLHLACSRISQYNQNMEYYQIPVDSPFTTQGLINWFTWLTADKKNQHDDPFNFLFIDPLLAKNYRYINEDWETFDHLRKIIDNSQKSVEYQLDRLYFLRNSITHSGRAGKLGETLWVHLEWYLGKLLAQSLEILSNSQINNANIEPKDLIWSEIRRKSIITDQYLLNNKTVKLTSEKIRESGIFDFPTFCH